MQKVKVVINQTVRRYNVSHKGIKFSSATVVGVGKSAYDIYKEITTDNPILNESDWIDSLYGQDGVTPTIGPNGNWFIGDTDTGTVAASDVYLWAKQPDKPAYNWSEIGSKPTLLSSFTNDLGNYGGWLTTTLAASTYVKKSGDVMTGNLTTKGLTITNGTKIVNLIVDADGYLSVDNSLYSSGEISAFGVGSGGSNGGGGLIQTVYSNSNLGGSFLNTTLTDTFNAYTINQINNRLIGVENGALSFATTNYVNTSINNLIGGAPTTLNTLNELATALGNDANMSTTLTNLIGTKAELVHTHNYELPLSFSTGLSRVGNTITNTITQYTNAMADARVVAGITGKQNVITTGTIAQYLRGDLSLATMPTTLPASDVYSWAKQSTKPAYVWSEIGSKPTLLSSFTNDLGNYGGWLTTTLAASTYVKKSGDVMTGNLTTKGLTITNGTKIVNLIVDADGYLSVDNSLYSSGEISAFGVGSGGSNGGGGLIQTVYSNSNLGGSFLNTTLTDTFNAYTINAINNRLIGVENGALTQISSALVTNALGYVPLPTRTFGTAANSAVGDFVQNQNSSAQSANMWISGRGTFNSVLTQYLVTEDIGAGIWEVSSNIANGFYMYKYGLGYILRLNQDTGAATFASTVNATQFNSIFSGYGTNASPHYDKALFSTYGNPIGISFGNSGQNSHRTHIKFTVNDNDTINNPIDILRLSYNEARFESSVNSNGFIRTNTEPIGYGANTGYLYFGSGTIDRWIGYDGSNFTLQDGNGVKTIYHSGNLTNNLSTNYIPKWNGSSMVNSLISDDGVVLNISNGVKINKSGIDRYALQLTGNNGASDILLAGQVGVSNGFTVQYNGSEMVYKFNNGSVFINSTTPSTSPTTGALVVGGGIGVSKQINFGNGYGHYGEPAAFNTSSDGDKLILYNNGTNYDGRIGVGTTGNLWIKSADNTGAAAFEIYTGAGTLNMKIFGNGNTMIGHSTDQGYKLAVNGSGYFNGNVTASGEITAYSSSDERLKENIKPLNQSLELINKLNPVSYNWNDKAKELNPNKTDKTDVGVIAQELEKVLPNLVHNIYNDEFLAVDYVKLIPYLIGAVQELTDKINKLENK